MTDSQPQLPSGLQQLMSPLVRHEKSVLHVMRLHVDGPASSGGFTHIPAEQVKPWPAPFWQS